MRGCVDKNRNQQSRCIYNFVGYNVGRDVSSTLQPTRGPAASMLIFLVERDFFHEDESFRESQATVRWEADIYCHLKTRVVDYLLLSFRI